jgi:hypothetical protein
MSTQKSKLFIVVSAIACIGCCTIPLYAILAGATGMGLTTILLNEDTIEVLKCLLPFLLFGLGYFLYRQYQAKKYCCSLPRDKCTSQQCGMPLDSEKSL